MNFRIAKNKIIVMLVVFTGGLVVVGNGCSRFLTAESGGSGSDDYSHRGDTTSDIEGSGNMHVIEGAPTAATVYSKAALESKEFQLGIKASDRTVGTYIEKRGSISAKGNVDSFTAPMGMAITAINADVCDDLINKQASLAMNQRFFRDFNMSANGRPTPAAMDFSIKALALAVWDRHAEPIELETLVDMVEESIASDEVNGQRKAALMLCTAINSTTESIVR